MPDPMTWETIPTGLVGELRLGDLVVPLVVSETSISNDIQHYFVKGGVRHSLSANRRTIDLTCGITNEAGSALTLHLYEAFAELHQSLYGTAGTLSTIKEVK